MNKRPLGKTGIEVSEIAFGGVEIGMPYGIGINNKSDMLPRSQAISLLQSALDRGINFFDTARMYGESESIIGQAFKKIRDQVVISTKCRHIKDPKGYLPDSNRIKKIIKGSVIKSLNELKTGYIDVYMLHQADTEILENETVSKTFLDLKRRGTIRATGVSTYSVEESKTAIESGIWDVIQLPFNLMDQSQETVFASAAKQGVGIMVRSVLFKGLLSSKGRKLHQKLNTVEQHIRQYDELINSSAPDLTSVAIKFALSFRQISSVLVGIDKMDYLQKAVDIANGYYFSKEILKRAKKLQYPDLQFLDLPKWDRMGWLT